MRLRLARSTQLWERRQFRHPFVNGQSNWKVTSLRARTYIYISLNGHCGKDEIVARQKVSRVRVCFCVVGHLYLYLYTRWTVEPAPTMFHLFRTNGEPCTSRDHRFLHRPRQNGFTRPRRGAALKHTQSCAGGNAWTSHTVLHAGNGMDDHASGLLFVHSTWRVFKNYVFDSLDFAFYSPTDDSCLSACICFMRLTTKYLVVYCFACQKALIWVTWKWKNIWRWARSSWHYI